MLLVCSLSLELGLMRRKLELLLGLLPLLDSSSERLPAVRRNPVSRFSPARRNEPDRPGRHDILGNTAFYTQWSKLGSKL